ncbi:hypothetical protein B9Z19DRAFT_182187 [Tuber borchii]|uniref:Uncharacterized protein n=1 Tax=Tuber borchii TaxID=42251 RepID=A0A2T6ZP09_TUBBO|nr:hypothetical protein B9Z19DRAFT_182187 [Tuber borchii]
MAPKATYRYVQKRKGGKSPLSFSGTNYFAINLTTGTQRVNTGTQIVNIGAQIVNIGTQIVATGTRHREASFAHTKVAYQRKILKNW